jgi:hypothetical protein
LKEFGMQSEPTESEFAKANIVNRWAVNLSS